MKSDFRNMVRILSVIVAIVIPIIMAVLWTARAEGMHDKVPAITTEHVEQPETGDQYNTSDEYSSSKTATTKNDRSELIKDIQKAVRNELIANRAFFTNAQSTQQPNGHDTSSLSDCSKDMSQYIRKDAIPCWGCSL